MLTHDVDGIDSRINEFSPLSRGNIPLQYQRASLIREVCHDKITAQRFHVFAYFGKIHSEIS